MNLLLFVSLFLTADVQTPASDFPSVMDCNLGCKLKYIRSSHAAFLSVYRYLAHTWNFGVRGPRGNEQQLALGFDPSACFRLKTTESRIVSIWGTCFWSPRAGFSAWADLLGLEPLACPYSFLQLSTDLVPWSVNEVCKVESGNGGAEWGGGGKREEGRVVGTLRRGAAHFVRRQWHVLCDQILYVVSNS